LDRTQKNIEADVPNKAILKKLKIKSKTKNLPPVYNQGDFTPWPSQNRTVTSPIHTALPRCVLQI